MGDVRSAWQERAPRLPCGLSKSESMITDGPSTLAMPASKSERNLLAGADGFDRPKIACNGSLLECAGNGFADRGITVLLPSLKLFQNDPVFAEQVVAGVAVHSKTAV